MDYIKELRKLIGPRKIILNCAGALILRERMQPKELIGCVIMFAAIVLAQIPQKRKPASSGGPS